MPRPLLVLSPTNREWLILLIKLTVTVTTGQAQKAEKGVHWKRHPCKIPALNAMTHLKTSFGLRKKQTQRNQLYMFWLYTPKCVFHSFRVKIMNDLSSKQWNKI
uniref:Secreted protein n=1 Tax=Rhipicephalus zambeziensis TaxID=60191 RepID=A0A224YEX6_9ACAR